MALIGRTGARWDIVRAAVGRGALLALVWLALTGADLRYAPLAVAIVGGATAVSLALAPPARSRLRPAGAIRFVPFFVRQSLLGGMDVARRALAPARPIEPDFIAYPLRLPVGAPRTTFTAVVSLLPGTLSTELVDDALIIHVLDRRLDAAATLANLERRVADLYGVDLPSGEVPD
jgi:multicomponent Na+:H+ antiporter subunit E